MFSFFEKYGNLVPAGIACMAILLIFSVWGIYLEDNEQIVAAINYGEFGPMGFDQLVTDYQFPFVPLLALISRTFDNLPVYGFWFILQLFVWLFALTKYTVKSLGSNNALAGWHLGLMLFLLLGLTADSIVYQHCIRNSMLLAFAGLLFTADALKQDRKGGTLPFLVFLLGLVARMHSAAIILAFFMAFHILSGRNILKVFKTHRYHLIISIVFLTIYQVHGLYTQNTGKYIESNYEYAILEKQSFHPLADMKNAKDSVKYKAVQVLFITDSAEFNNDFLKRVVDLNYQDKVIFSEKNITNAIADLRLKATEFLYPLLLSAILILVGLGISYSGKNGWYPVAVILFVSFGIVAALLLILVDEIKSRFFSPYLTITSFFVLITLFPPALAKAGRAGKALLTVIVLLLCLSAGYKLSVESYAQKEKEQANKKAMEKIKTYSATHPVIAFVGSDIPFCSGVFNRPPDLAYKNIAYFDAGYLTYYSYIRTRFETLLGCSPLNYPALINLFKTNSNIRFYATEQRLEIVKAYFLEVYSVNLVFDRVTPQPAIGLNGSIYTVRIL